MGKRTSPGFFGTDPGYATRGTESFGRMTFPVLLLWNLDIESDAEPTVNALADGMDAPN